VDLLLDLGHSRLKWAYRDAGALHDTGFAVWHGEPPGAAFERALAPLRRPERVAIAAVARGEPLRALEAVVRARWGLVARVPAVTRRCGDVVCGYAQADRLGFDRWAALVGAWAREPGRAAVVVDCGSAVTVDALQADGRHLGGIIFPGPAMMVDAFHARTGLPREEAPAPFDLAASSTGQAVASGARTAVLGGIERALRHWEARLPGASRWLTGGDAPQFAADLPVGMRLAPHLVLEGLWVMMDRERQ
jgi:type III pantothenate kinase